MTSTASHLSLSIDGTYVGCQDDQPYVTEEGIYEQRPNPDGSDTLDDYKGTSAWKVAFHTPRSINVTMKGGNKIKVSSGSILYPNGERSSVFKCYCFVEYRDNVGTVKGHVSNRGNGQGGNEEGWSGVYGGTYLSVGVEGYVYDFLKAHADCAANLRGHRIIWTDEAGAPFSTHDNLCWIRAKIGGHKDGKAPPGLFYGVTNGVTQPINDCVQFLRALKKGVSGYGTFQFRLNLSTRAASPDTPSFILGMTMVGMQVVDTHTFKSPPIVDKIVNVPVTGSEVNNEILSALSMMHLGNQVNNQFASSVVDEPVNHFAAGAPPQGNPQGALGVRAMLPASENEVIEENEI